MTTGTAHYNWQKPIVGGDSDTWGTELNALADAQDASLFALASNIIGALGYTPLNKVNDAATGLDIIPSANPDTNAAGFLGAPINRQDNNYTLVMGDAGRTLLHSNGTAHTYTLPAQATVNFPLGTLIRVINDNLSGILTINPAAGVSLRFRGASPGARNLDGSQAYAELLKYSTDVWLITGFGIT